MFSIIKSHFHKGKTGFFITGLFVILSVFMMLIGLSICLGMSKLYYNARNLSNSADATVLIANRNQDFKKIVEDYIISNEDVEDYGVKNIYWFESSSEHIDDSIEFVYEKGNSVFSNFLINNIDAQNDKYKPHIRNEVSGEGFKLYVTGNLVETSNIKVGNTVYFHYQGKNHKGYVAGIFDSMTDIYLTSTFYVDSTLYEMVEDFAKTDNDFYYYDKIDVRFNYKTEKECEQIGDDFYADLKQIYAQYAIQHPTDGVGFSYNSKTAFINATNPFIMILGAALVAFSVLIALIVALVIAFLVRSSIIAEVRNLGILKSLGYTTDMLRLSYLAIYTIISCICMLVGMILGISLMPTFVNLITVMARFDCVKAIGLNVGSIFAAMALIILVITSVSMLATGRIKRITPLSAMRNNIATHSFKRNLVPLNKTKVPVNTSLGLKSIVGERGRSIMVVTIVLIMSLLCSFVSVVFFNLKVDQTAIINMSAIEVPDWSIRFDYEDNSLYYEAIRKMDGYKYDTLGTIGTGGYVNENYVMGWYYEDFDKLRTNVVYEGKNPKYANEILWEVGSAKSKGFSIGDSITITFNNNGEEIKKECVIVGFFQSIINHGQFLGKIELLSFYFTEEYEKNSTRYFYFEKGKVPTSNEINEYLLNTFDEEYIKYNGFQQGINMVKNQFLNTVETAADAVMSVFIAITAIVISLLLVMLIKLKLLREKRDYAIYKALGYTTPNIMTQIAIAMVILGVVGSLFGSIIGALLTSPILSLAGNIIGIGKFAFIVPWGYIVAIIFAIPLLVYLVSMLCAVPVKKIAPATLLRERG